MTIFFSIIAYFALGFAVAFLGTKVRIFKNSYLYVVDNKSDFISCFFLWPAFLFVMFIIKSSAFVGFVFDKTLGKILNKFDFYKDLDNF